tara:strand:- start:15577 stop:17997 length:2421 start_codon:yes stop_codon:yes gene_type:complete
MSIRSYVKIKPISEKGAFTDGFNELRKGINRTGAVTESIGKNYVETHKLIKFEKEWLSDKQETDIDTANLEDKDDKKKHRGFLSRFVRMFRRNRRKETENAAEEGEKDADKDVDKKKKEAKGPMKSFLGMITGFLTPIFKFFLAMGVLDWLSKSPEKAQKVFKAIFAIAKFGWAVVGFGINKVMDGLTNLFGKGFDEGPIKRTFRFMGGFLQLASGIAALRFASYMVMPWKLITDVNRLRSVFGAQADQQGEAEAQAAWRKKGYKDRKTGVIYTEKEYKTMRKSARRAGKDNAFQQRVGPTVKQRGRNVKAGALKKWRKGKGIIGKKMKGIGGKLSSPGMMKGVAVLGGVSRIATGIQSGEDATEAVGAGIGQAAGGMLGAAAGTALLGPFLGPFAPIVGNAIGSFLGEWVGKTFLPLIKPLFEPIGRMFKMYWTIVSGLMKETGYWDFLSTLFKFIGKLGEWLMSIMGPLGNFIKVVMGPAISLIGKIIGMVIGAVKNMIAFAANPIGFAWRVIRGKDPGANVDLAEEKSKGGEVKIVKRYVPVFYAAAGGAIKLVKTLSGGGDPGPVRITDYVGRPTPDQYVYSWQEYRSKHIEKTLNGEVVDTSSSEEYEEYLGSIDLHQLMKHNKDIMDELIALKKAKPHNTIRDILPGGELDGKIHPRILYPILNNSVAAKLTEKRIEREYKQFLKDYDLVYTDSEGNRKVRAYSIYNENFSEGGETPVVPTPEPSIHHTGVPTNIQMEMMVKDRDAAKEMTEYHFSEEAMDDIAPQVITITRKVLQPIINNQGSGATKVVYTKPSPMLSC